MSIVPDTAATTIPTGTWTIDPVHSSVEFHVTHTGVATVKGRALVVSGTVHGGEDASIEGTVDVSSLTTFDETRDTHLRTPDFFDAERYPELHFRSTEVTRRDDRVLVAGDLTIRGVTKPVELEGTFQGPNTDPYGRERIGVDLEGVVDRRAFGVSWNAPLPGGGELLPNEVPLVASFSAIKEA
jgi:polyisoprenoid-binding protein YceI